MILMNKVISYFIALTLVCSPVFAGDTTSLQAAWTLDEASGTRVDETANNNDLTDNNTVLQGTGQFGDAADFEADNTEWLSITDASQNELDITGDFTFLAWIDIEATATNKNILDKSTNGASGYAFRISDADGIALDIEGSSPASTSSIISGSGFEHVAATYDDSANEVEFFDAGVSDSTVTQNDNPSDNANDFVLGRRNSNGSLYFDGLMDEVVVFSRELSSAEINDIMDNGIEAFITGTARSRVIIIATTMFTGWSAFEYDLGSKIDKHRKKFSVKRPNWMKVFYGN